MRISPIRMGIIKPISFGIKINGKEGSFEDLYGALDLTKETSENKKFPNTVQNPNDMYYKREHYYIDSKSDKKIPVDDVLRKETPKGSMLYTMENGSIKPYTGYQKKTYKGRTVKETLFMEGFPRRITQYKDGKPFEETCYDIITRKRESVTLLDGSFALSKYDHGDHTELEFDKIKNDKKIHIEIEAPKTNGTGHINCTVLRKIPNRKERKYFQDINWKFPEMRINTQGSEDKREILNALRHLQKTLYSPEYKNDFGKTGYLNVQLRDVIKYLEK